MKENQSPPEGTELGAKLFNSESGYETSLPLMKLSSVGFLSVGFAFAYMFDGWDPLLKGGTYLTPAEFTDDDNKDVFSNPMLVPTEIGLLIIGAAVECLLPLPNGVLSVTILRCADFDPL